MFEWVLKMFGVYERAKAEAEATGRPLWDTHSLPERWAVGRPSAEIEEDPDNADWEQID